jgi:hypothetical protein
MPSASAFLTRTRDGDTHPVPYVKEPSRLWDRDPVLFLRARYWSSFQAPRTARVAGHAQAGRQPPETEPRPGGRRASEAEVDLNEAARQYHV